VHADLAALRDNGWLAGDALVVVERSSRGEGLAWPEGFVRERERKYGETVLCYGHATA
jgi:16S rRNA (guanine966-N2)-methyltransferase